jgi:N-methylhydantoinase A
MKESIRIGVDTGGTFTDFVVVIGDHIKINKIPSTPDNPSLSILNGHSRHNSSHQLSPRT